MKVNYKGDLLAPSGYSRAARAHMQALIQAGVEVSGTVNAHDRNRVDLSHHPFWAERMKQIIEDPTESPIRISQETPEFLDPDPTRYEIAYTVFETSRIPDTDIGGDPRTNWVSQLNRMGEVWSASEFCKRVFQKSGVTVPINVFPHPIDLEQYSPGEPNEGYKGADLKGKMVFLSVFQWTARKNPLDLLTSWVSEFHAQEDVALILKTYSADFSSAEQITQYIQGVLRLMRVPNRVHNVYLLPDMVPDEDIPDLYRSCDVTVTPSYGEGFGLGPQEGQACGKPSIYTNASALPEFCVGYPIECDPVPVSGMPHIPWYNTTQDWWRVRPASLKQAFRQAYDEWKDGTIQGRGGAARQKIEELHSFETVGKAMRARLESVVADIRHGKPEMLALWPELSE